MKAYSGDFFGARNQKTRYSAETILSIVLERYPGLSSAIDVGSGVGTWLSVLREMGVSEIHGVDGHWVNEELLVIPKDCFERVDLSEPIRLSGKYDLAISLEVAEHLPPSRASGFVETLVGLADLVLFSAAIPHQGGKNHVNEQWQGYWVDQFNLFGYSVHDFIRPMIWDDSQIRYWYRQNVLLFSKELRSSAPDQVAGRPSPSPHQINVVHPELYLEKANPNLGIKLSAKRFLGSLGAFFAKVFRQTD